MTAAIMEKPIDKHERLNEDLNIVRDDLQRMGRMVGEIITGAAEALMRGDSALAAAVIRRDDAVDDLEVQIETAVFQLLEAQSIDGADLRFLSSTLKVINDLERIGDHAVNISKTTQRIAAEGARPDAVVDFRQFVRIAREMLRDGLLAFMTQDAALAHAVVQRDDEADVLCSEAQRELRGAMPQLGDSAGAMLPVLASHLLFVAHDLEKICDHCTSIAKRVVFSETGEFIAPEGGK